MGSSYNQGGSGQGGSSYGGGNYGGGYGQGYGQQSQYSGQGGQQGGGFGGGLVGGLIGGVANALGFGNDQGQQGHRGRGPKNYSRSDTRIEEDVHERLMHDPLDASGIEVSVKDGEVTLTGTVKLALGEAARRGRRRRRVRREARAEQPAGAGPVLLGLRPDGRPVGLLHGRLGLVLRLDHRHLVGRVVRLVHVGLLGVVGQHVGNLLGRHAVLGRLVGAEQRHPVGRRLGRHIGRLLKPHLTTAPSRQLLAGRLRAAVPFRRSRPRDSERRFLISQSLALAKAEC
jgi:hypothetical protein